MNDIKRKLTSRKFWLSVASFVSMLIVAIYHDNETATEISALIMAGASVIGYVIGEGLADGKDINLTNNYGSDYTYNTFEEGEEEDEGN